MVGTATSETQSLIGLPCLSLATSPGSHLRVNFVSVIVWSRLPSGSPAFPEQSTGPEYRLLSFVQTIKFLCISPSLGKIAMLSSVAGVVNTTPPVLTSSGQEEKMAGIKCTLFIRDKTRPWFGGSLLGVSWDDGPPLTTCRWRLEWHIIALQ